MSMLPMDMKPEHIICYDKSFCKNDPISLSYEGGNHYKALISCGHHFSGSRPGERELLTLSAAVLRKVRLMNGVQPRIVSNRELDTALEGKKRMLSNHRESQS